MSAGGVPFQQMRWHRCVEGQPTRCWGTQPHFLNPSVLLECFGVSDTRLGLCQTCEGEILAGPAHPAMTGLLNPVEQPTQGA